MLAARGPSPVRNQALAALLRCPSCRTRIALSDDRAVCKGAKHTFPVIRGIPVFLDDETVGGDPQYVHQRRYFDAEFADYDIYRLENWRRSYLDRLGTGGLLDTEAPVLDVGVGGSGYTVIEAARTGSLAVGCDLSLQALVAARRFAESEGVAERTFWVCCSAERLPLASASFGSALAVAVIEHVPDDHAALAEIARVLEPGGRCWVTVPHGLRNIPLVFRLPNRRHDRRLGHLRRYEAESLVHDGGQAGLAAVDVQFTGHPVKAVQLGATTIPGEPLGDRFWWWCERRDLRRSTTRRGSMQLSVLFERAA